MNEPIYRRVFDANELVKGYPAELTHPNKELVFGLTCPAGALHQGQLNVTRWKQRALPAMLERGSMVIESRDNYFTYDPSEELEIDWRLNFSHSHMFCAYGDSLFAQDEMQVAEHPALGSLRHALLDSDDAPLTVEAGVATPILIAGVERRCAIATDPNPEALRPYGLYGNEFAEASEDAILRATTLLTPPTLSNILAMEAPPFGEGQYTAQQIQFVLATAYTGFLAACHESRRMGGDNTRTVIHTGYWGCGAYGGNRELMPLLQLLAACGAGVHRLVFHTGGDPDGYAQAERRLHTMLPSGGAANLEELIGMLETQGFLWGVSDGN